MTLNSSEALEASSNKFSPKTRWEKFFKLFIYQFFFSFFINFKNLTDEFHLFYVLNMYIKFHSNQMLFIIRLINLFFYTQFYSIKT